MFSENIAQILCNICIIYDFQATLHKVFDIAFIISQKIHIVKLHFEALTQQSLCNSATRIKNALIYLKSIDKNYIML